MASVPALAQAHPAAHAYAAPAAHAYAAPPAHAYAAPPASTALGTPLYGGTIDRLAGLSGVLGGLRRCPNGPPCGSTSTCTSRRLTTRARSHRSRKGRRDGRTARLLRRARDLRLRAARPSPLVSRPAQRPRGDLGDRQRGQWQLDWPPADGRPQAGCCVPGRRRRRRRDRADGVCQRLRPRPLRRRARRADPARVRAPLHPCPGRPRARLRSAVPLPDPVRRPRAASLHRRRASGAPARDLPARRARVRRGGSPASRLAQDPRAGRPDHALGLLARPGSALPTSAATSGGMRRRTPCGRARRSSGRSGTPSGTRPRRWAGAAALGRARGAAPGPRRSYSPTRFSTAACRVAPRRSTNSLASRARPTWSMPGWAVTSTTASASATVSSSEALRSPNSGSAAT
jgi:hypothetical protein